MVKQILSALSIFCIFILCTALHGAKLNPDIPLNRKSPDTSHSTTALITIYSIAKQHYNGGMITAEKFAVIYDAYLKQLDPSRIYLTRTEVEYFRKKFTEYGKNILKGDLAVPFEMFNHMQERFIEYDLFARELLSGDTDALVSGNEIYRYDRTEAPWEPDMAALREQWRKRLINDLIILKLSDRETMRKLAAAEAKKNAGDALSEDEKSLAKPLSKAEERLLKRITQTRQLYAEMEGIEVLELFLNAISAAYDPHTAYLSPASDEDFNIHMSLKLTGIGAVLTSEDGYTKVVEVVAGGPADRDGRLKAGDRIIAVQQEDETEPTDVINMPLNKVVKKIRGPADTRVTLTILSGKNGLNSVPAVIQITRAEVIMKDSEASGKIRLMPQADGSTRKLGIIELPSFYMDFEAAYRGSRNYKCASSDVRKILEDFNKQGVDGIIFDLRGNGGGSLPDAVTLTGLFIKDGPVVQVRDSEHQEILNDNDREQVYTKPMVVLVNRLSASASEIFAGAIRDYGRGVVVGDAKTHGKGTVQTMKQLDLLARYLLGKKIKAGSAKITTAKFYRINGESTQLKGVIPDIIFPSFFDSMDMGEDKLDNPMPWDTIRPAEFSPVKPEQSFLKTVAALRSASLKRISESPEFKTLEEHIERYRKLTAAREVSLNLEKRWAEYQEEKRLSEEQTKMFHLESLSGNRKDESEKDLYLEESLNILNDLISTSSK